MMKAAMKLEDCFNPDEVEKTKNMMKRQQSFQIKIPFAANFIVE